MSLNNPVEIRQRFVPITHSRVREAIDVIEERLHRACSDRRPVDLNVKIEQNGNLSLTLVIGEPIERELSGDEARAALAKTFDGLVSKLGEDIKRHGLL